MLSCWLFAFSIDLVASFVVHAICALMPAVFRGVMTVLCSLFLGQYYNKYCKLKGSARNHAKKRKKKKTNKKTKQKIMLWFEMLIK